MKLFFIIDQHGVVGIIFALVSVPVIVMGGSAIDFGIWHRTHYNTHSSLDSTALAISNYASTMDRNNGRDMDRLLERSKRIFNANFHDRSQFTQNPDLEIVFHNDGKGLDLRASVHTKTFFINLIGIRHLNVEASTSVRFASQNNIDVVMVLDNSDSMTRPLSGNGVTKTRMERLHEAAGLFVTNLVGDKANNQSNIKIGIVPFDRTVNVGAAHVNEPWMDTRARSPIHSEFFYKKRGHKKLASGHAVDRYVKSRGNRFDFYKSLNKRWPGCVEVRPQPYDTYDYNPHRSKMRPEDRALNVTRNARFFVPWFYPDSSDKAWEIPNASHQQQGRGAAGSNNFLKDRTKGSGVYSTHANITEKAEFWLARQGNVRKYLKPERNGRSCSSERCLRDHSYSPGKLCSVQEITDLTKDSGLLQRKIQLMKPAESHGTNTLQAFTWGWRVLTPGIPFTRGGRNHRKILILLADGAHTYSLLEKNPNLGEYTSFGFPSANRLNLLNMPALENIQNMNYEKFRSLQAIFNANNINKMDSRLERACKNARNDGIIIYTISFGSDIGVHYRGGRTIRDCASEASKYYHASDDITNVFQDIATEIKQLYLSK